MRCVIFNLLLSALFVGDLYSMELQIIDRHLNNKDCKSGVSYRSWEDAWEHNKNIKIKPGDISFLKFIILHYTVSPTVESTYNAYNSAGVSAHYTLDRNGDIYRSVNPKHYISFNAGLSSFAEYIALNYHSISMEHINPGYKDTFEVVAGFPKPQQVKGDSRWWYPFSDEQFKSSCILTKELQKKYKIPGWNVVTHADVSIGRKSDIGPLWNYKRAFDEYGVGHWYDESHQIRPSTIEAFDASDYAQMIGFIGYNSDDTELLIRAYQMHYVCSEISGSLTENTKKAVLKHIISLKDCVSPITGKKYEYFDAELQKWIKNNPNKASVLAEYFAI